MTKDITVVDDDLAEFIAILNTECLRDPIVSPCEDILHVREYDDVVTARGLKGWEAFILDRLLGFLVEVRDLRCLLECLRFTSNERVQELRDAVNEDLLWRRTKSERMTVPNY